jgi:hypothetical protein
MRAIDNSPIGNAIQETMFNRSWISPRYSIEALTY